MENKKKRLSIVFLVIAIILIIIMGGLLYIQKIEIDKQIAELDKNNTDLYNANLKINELEKKIAKLELDSEILDDILNSIEKEIDGFITGHYSYDYIEIMEEGEESEWKLELSMGFSFKNDGTVYGFLPGHESGMLVGTYTIYDKKITCKFTEYENECSSTYDLKLDEEGELVLNRLNEYELSIANWDKIPMLEDSNLSYGEGKIFTVNLVER